MCELGSCPVHTRNMMVFRDLAPTSSDVKAEEGMAHWPHHARVRSLMSAAEAFPSALLLLTGTCPEGPAASSHLTSSC